MDLAIHYLIVSFIVCGADTVASQATAMDDITWLQAHTNYTYYGTNVTRVCIVVEFIDKHSDIYRLIHGLFHIALVISTRP